MNRIVEMFTDVYDPVEYIIVIFSEPGFPPPRYVTTVKNLEEFQLALEKLLMFASEAESRGG